VRTDWWWSLLTSTAGVGWANDYTQYAGSSDGTNGSFTYANANNSNGLGSDGHTHLKAGIAFYRSLRWWTLIPANVGPFGALVTSGSGASGTQTWVAAAADPQRGLLMAYAPPAFTGSFSVDMTRVGANAAAWWVDPSNGAKQFIGALANTGTHSFTPPGANAYGANDWVLCIQATPDPVRIGRWH
jgi:hypothetical protein